MCYSCRKAALHDVKLASGKILIDQFNTDGERFYRPGPRFLPKKGQTGSKGIVYLFFYV
jgi:hypothetical protein